MRIKNGSGKREFQPQCGSGISGFERFERSGCENREGIVAGNGITTFYVLNFINLGRMEIFTSRRAGRMAELFGKKGRNSGI